MITPKESNDTMEKEDKKGTAKVESPTLIKSKKEGVSIKEEEEEEVPPKVIAGKDKEKDKIDDEQSQKQPSENAKNETEKSNAGTENIDLFKSLTKVEFKSLVKEDDKDSAKDTAKNEVPKANIESVKSQVKEDVKDAVKPTEIKEEQKPELSNLIKSSVNEISKSTAKYNELKEEQKPEYDLETSLVKKDPSKNTEGNDEPKPNIDLVKSMIKETSISISKNNEGSKEEQNPNFDVFKSLDKDYDKDMEKSEMKPSSKIGSNIQNSPVKENVKSKILNKEISPVLTVKSKLKDKIKSTLENRKSKIDTVKSKLADKTQSKSRISSKIGDGKGPIGDMPNISLDKTPGIRTCADELCIERKGYLFKRETLKYTNRSFIYKAAGMTSVPVICKITLLDCYPPHVKENYLKNSTRIIRYVGGNGGEPPLSTFVRVYEIFQIDFKSYTFMNQVSSPSVLEMIKKRSKFSQEKARQWTRSLCDAVQFLQKRGIAHRGVKIDHVHFDQSQTLKLLGWGRSTFFWDETNGTYIQQVKESKSFANCHFPPEAFQGLYNPFYTDVWSIGVFLTAVHTRRHVYKVKSNISFASQWSAFEVTHRFSPHVLDLLRHIFVTSTLNRAKINWIMEHAYWNAPLNEIEQPKKTEKKGKTPATQTTTETVVQNDSSVKSRSKPIANKNGEDEDATEETETEPKVGN